MPWMPWHLRTQLKMKHKSKKISRKLGRKNIGSLIAKILIVAVVLLYIAYTAAQFIFFSKNTF